MLSKLRKVTRGFTLIELLVVIAIIGLLASIVLVSLTSARKKARDSRRLGDLRQVQLALEMYFDAQSSYPIGGAIAGAYTLQQASDLWETTMTTELVPYVRVPLDPLNAADPVAITSQAYGYVPGNSAASTVNCQVVGEKCVRYILATNLEDATNPALDANHQPNGWTNPFPCGAVNANPFCAFN